MADCPSVGDYLRTLKLTVPKMVGQIKELAVAEITPVAKHGGIGAGLFGGAGAFGWIALKTLGLTACFALSLIYYELVDLDAILSLTLGFLTGSILLLIFAAIFALIGRSQIKRVKAPEATIAEVKASVSAISEAVTKGGVNAQAGGYPVDAEKIVSDPRFTTPRDIPVEY